MPDYKNTLPMPVKAHMYSHQINAFDFACEVFGLLSGTNAYISRGIALFYEMGTGKSLCAIAICGMLYQMGLINKILIVAPLSILGVWREEFEKFADYPYNLVVLSGSSEKKKKQLSELPDDALNVVVVNYESTWRVEEALLPFAKDAVIVADEGHKIKENRSKQSKAMHRLGDVSAYRLLLTGTPITNKEVDVYSEYRFLNSNIFGESFYRFRSRYFDMLGYGNHIPVFRECMRDDFLERLHRIAIRTTKEEALDLPETYDEVRYVDLEPKAKAIYQQIAKENYAALGDGEVSTPNILTRLLRLSQITGGFVTDDTQVSTAVSTAKLDALSDIFDTAQEENKKIVVIAHYRAEMDAIEQMLQKKKLGYAVVRGGVKDRDGEVRRFQNDPDCLCFLGQISAAGLGITLTAASTMVFYSMNYSSSDFTQAKARIHRVSQRNACQYIYLICRGTVDTKVLRSVRDKLDLAKMIVDDYRHGGNPFDDKEDFYE